MTIDEAIERLKTDIYKYADFTENPNENEFWMAFDMAIKALEQQPCEDKIIEWKKDFKEYVNSLSIPRDDYKGIMEYIDELPVTSQQPCYNPDGWCHDCSEYDQVKHCCPRFNRVIRNAVEEIKQPKTHWISYWDEEARCYVYKCPECGNKQPFDTKHCWKCGARMIEPQAESEEP